MRWRLGDAVRDVGGHLTPEAEADTDIERVVIDHREVTPGTLFVALPGTRTHGRHFAEAAAAAGAAAILLEPPVPTGLPAWVTDQAGRTLARLGAWALARTSARVAAVTGSVGKTSTKLLMAAVLGRRWATAATPGNFNTPIGLPLAILSLDPAVQWFVAEMGMRALGEIRALCEMAPPDIAVITNIGVAHLGELGSREAILRAKAEIVEGLKPNGVAVLNRADPLLQTLRPARKTVWYGEPGTAVWADGLRPERGRVTFALVGEGFRESVRLPWDGVHQVQNAVAAAAVGLVAGLSPRDIAAGLSSVDPGAGHFRRIRTAHWTVLDDTYNASPDSMRAGLRVLEREPGRRVAVLGDMLELGPEEEALHRAVGAAVTGCADQLVAVGPRGRWIAETAAAAGVPTVWVEDLHAAWDWLQAHLEPGDTVYVKASRAMALNQLVEDLVRWDSTSP
jgi:UDP-N-acetylmuramoyl-tripeptide--D-alanyl-D-alanine ligase